MWLLLAMVGCTADPGGTTRRPPGSPDTDATSDSVPDSDAVPDSDTVPADTDLAGPCATSMVLVDERFCIDAYEATLDEQVGGVWQPASPYYLVNGRTVRASVGRGRVPQAYISGVEAGAACEAAGKRLCTDEEWLAACQGPDATVYPYGNTYDASACNTSYEGGNGSWGHPVEDLFDSSDVWDMDHMNDPRIDQQPNTVDPGGSHDGCVSAWGAYDMHGNVHEWTADPDGTFRGGFFADAAINGPGCLYRTTAHDTTYHDYSTGFRCCADPAPP
jgi:sulfatase modifying factor 1